MKKFYLPVFTLLLLTVSSFSRAQITYNTLTTGSSAAPLDLGLLGSWAAPGIPPDNCTDCIININSFSIISDNTAPQNLTRTTINVLDGQGFIINQVITMSDGVINVGLDNSCTACAGTGLILEDQVNLIGTSVVNVANNACFIDGTNPDGRTVHGSRVDYYQSAFDTPQPAFYYITASDPALYDISLSLNGQGNSPTNPIQPVFFDPYLLNCNPPPGGGSFPNDCLTGYVFGPATTGFNPSGSFYGFLQATLPVDLVLFDADKNTDGTVKVFWSTAQELNAAFYEVMRSADQKHWEVIGKVVAKGNSSITTNYTFKDPKIVDGVTYYQLRMVDLDAKSKLSPIAVVKPDGEDGPLTVYNNPFSDAIRIRVNTGSSDKVTLTVTDVVGRVYIRQSYSTQAGNNYINLVPAGATSGMYILHVKGNRFDRTIKLIKQ